MGVDYILVEKPAALSSSESATVIAVLKEVQAAGRSPKVFVAYNRRFYAGILKAQEMIKEDGGVTSFQFDFTEWTHTFEARKDVNVVGTNLLVANSSHVIDTAFFLGGEPAEWSVFAGGPGHIPWHSGSSRWVGSGVTKSGALFSYHANWCAPGRWSAEFNTGVHKLIFRPMEKLQVTNLKSVKIEEVPIDYDLDQKFKPGLYIQTKAFLNVASEIHPNLLTFEEHHRHLSSIYEKLRVTPLKTPVVVLIGAGNIGSRHLQGLAAADIPLDIHVIEPFESAQETAKSRFESVAGSQKHRVVWYKEISDLSKSLDVYLAIVATTAGIRFKLTKQLVDSVKSIKHLMEEKVLFQTNADHVSMGQLMTEQRAKGNLVCCYVNTCVRLFDHIQKMRQLLPVGQPVNVSVTGHSWGLCCNSLHYVDLFLLLNGPAPLRYDMSGLEPGYTESKRAGMLEVFGTVTATHPNGAILFLSCLPGTVRGPHIGLDSSPVHSFYDLQLQELTYMAPATGQKWKSEKIPIQYVSQLTGRFVDALVQNKPYEAATLDVMLERSRELNNALLQFFAKAGHPAATQGICMIT
eukprot:NODE_145_length_2120_cov_108.274461_g121_i0.p1 GENE.NODE_145_length_2120_cov_108.274461_g121_i0~~NODE_145_length_2120_cov_108.274461_g121_i0.p1  ORF type:complete len:577 (+),score=81.97 NODE_145_length_2120_cov_108.274461_g121_i0:324-2054(+)